MTVHGFLTALSPIEYRENDPENRVASVRQTLAEHEQNNSPFQECPMVHMSRLQILDRLTAPMGDTSSAALKTKYLLCAINIDGRVDDFLDCLYRVNPGFVHDVWGRCVGYPAYKGAVFFRRYINRCLFEKPLGYAGFPASVEDVFRALTQKQAVADWVTSHQNMSDAELKQAWHNDRDKFLNPTTPKPGNF